MSKILKTQITAWKKQHGEVFEVSVEDKKGYFRAPDRNILSAFLAKREDMVGANEILAKNCWLGGDEALLQEDSYFLALMSQLGRLIQVKEAALKKL